MSRRCGIFMVAWATLARGLSFAHTGKRTCPCHPRGHRQSGVGAFLILLLAAAPSADAHPLSQGALDVTVQPARVFVRARVTAEEVAVTHMLVPPAPGEGVEPP